MMHAERNDPGRGIPSAIIPAFPPNADALLSQTGSLITDDMLTEISEADYGQDADEHLAPLLTIRDSVQVPAPLEWHPKEVLELIRWSMPQDPDWKPGSIGARGHKMRAFCCAALLRAGADSLSEPYLQGENQTLAALIESVLFLKGSLPRAAAQFLTFRIPRLLCQARNIEERPLFAFGLMVLVLMDAPAIFSLADIGQMIDFVEESAIDVRDPTRAGGVFNPRDTSFLSLSGYDLRHDLWRSFALRLRLAFPDNARLVSFCRITEARN